LSVRVRPEILKYSAPLLVRWLVRLISPSGKFLREKNPEASLTILRV
jgi:hypothetical protein